MGDFRGPCKTWAQLQVEATAGKKLSLKYGKMPAAAMEEMA